MMRISHTFKWVPSRNKRNCVEALSMGDDRVDITENGLHTRRDRLFMNLYMHEFRVPVAPERAAPETVSPIKTMSYAIQDSPWRPWPELPTSTVLICWSLVLLL